MPKPDEASTALPTVEQANAALMSLLSSEPAPADPDPEPEPAGDPPSQDEPGGDESPHDTDESVPPQTDPPAASNDDVASLRARLAEHETRVKEIEESANRRIKAMQDRHGENERILREKHLRKSSVVDRALKVLKAARSADGVPQAEADRVIAEIESTMNPASPSYVPPPPDANTIEDQKLVLNAFLNQQNMTVEEAVEFLTWTKSEASNALTPYELAVAERDVDAFLRLAHTRWREGAKVADTTKQRNDAIEAARVVQRRQRETARAASATTTAPRKTTPAPRTPPDPRKLTSDDVSRLFKQSIEEAKNS